MSTIIFDTATPANLGISRICRRSAGATVTKSIALSRRTSSLAACYELSLPRLRSQIQVVQPAACIATISQNTMR